MFLDIRRPVNIEGGEKYFIDTNVWYWMTYVPSKEFVANPPQEYQVETYPAFVEKALEGRAELFYSPLILVELAGLIERSEHAIYKRYHGDISLKRFRKKAAERRAVVQEIRSAWDTIRSMAAPLTVNVDFEFSDSLLDVIDRHGLDGYDAVYCRAMQENGVVNIITDDKDFRVIDDFKLYGCYPG